MSENWVSTVDARGRFTIPVELREQLGLRPGTVVSFVPIKNGILVRVRRKKQARKQPRHR